MFCGDIHLLLFFLFFSNGNAEIVVVGLRYLCVCVCVCLCSNTKQNSFQDFTFLPGEHLRLGILLLVVD